ncbi:helix-turn-helix domain-containing protein [uncultured Gemmiger sp.]|uniref:helix-turn-helix transcriptional regulator n=1 Tax=uncultured Gemmiger sp. TaxID=1623490 RepID=UPI0027DC3B25|nr:helix-turn-helix domain-containing protein [uncultured Gemmiger sp.]
MISDNIKRLRENMGLSQAALARKLGVTRASVNAWEMELSSPTAVYLVEMARLFHTTTDDILGLGQEEQISLRGMSDQEKHLVYDLVEYINSQKNA